MIDELFLYDRDAGLFKNILKSSTVIEGRYHVSPDYGNDLNTGNLASFIKDTAYGLTDVKQKYPICVCMTPKSRIVNMNGSRWEEFFFNLFFLAKAFTTGNGQIKSVDRSTNTSAHHPWYDWKDMKECAANFLAVLNDLIRKKTTTAGTPLKTEVVFEFDKAVISRLTNFNTDKLSGVGVTFNMLLNTGVCTLTDYTADALDDIVIPPFTIHPAHKH